MPYYRRWNFGYRRRFPYRRKPRYFTRYSRRFRRPLRRRWRRRWRTSRYRVRKKFQKLRLNQWQPAHIRKCKIKGRMPVIICGKGRQQWNFTQHKNEIIPPKMSGGGSFAVLVFNLQFLWEDHNKWRNFWTTPNGEMDLCRYTGTKIKIWRPATVDVCLTITKYYPMLINAGTFASTHPHRILMGFKKYVIQSLKRKPNGKKYKTIRIKCPQLLTNRWFFQKDFVKTNLFMMNITTCDLTRPYCTISGDNNNAGFLCLNTDIIKNVNFQSGGTMAWQPQKGKNFYGFYEKNPGDGKKWHRLSVHNIYGPGNPFYNLYLQGRLPISLADTNKGDQPSGSETNPPGESVTGKLVYTARYNPTPDPGDDNEIYMLTMFRTDDNLEPSNNTTFLMKGLPLWLVTFGYFDWMIKSHENMSVMSTMVTVIKSPLVTTIPPLTSKFIIPIGDSFYNGLGLFDTPIAGGDLTTWYVKNSMQSPAINNIVTCGPFVARPDKEFSWCVDMSYTVYFKWGGTTPLSQPITDPATQNTYPLPGDLSQRLQVRDPKKQKELHPWEYRRGMLTETALKRMLEDSETSENSDFFTETPTKKKKTGEDPLVYLSGDPYSVQHSSGTESSDQEEENQETPETLQLYIQQQQRKQRRLKHKLFHFLKKIQDRQRSLSILTGPME
nr:MAG: ORF1 [Torque teno midi virus]